MSKTLLERFLSKIEQTPSCWNWVGGKNSDGYGSIKFDGHHEGAHRSAYQLFVGDIPEGMHVCHRCDNPSCVNYQHLWLGSHFDNMADAKRKGRFVKGEGNGRHKLTESQVLDIVASPDTLETLSRRFGVSTSTVHRAKTGENWKHLIMT